MTSVDLENKTIFITGVAGFIGSNLAKRILKDESSVKVIGIDNMNDYYDIQIKESRLEELSSNSNFSEALLISFFGISLFTDFTMTKRVVLFFTV